MILDNPINEDYRVQSLRMRFNSIVQQNKLIIQATCQGDNSQYTGKIAQNVHFSFNQILQHLDARTFGILSKNQDILRLEIMQQEVELYSMSKLQLNELQQMMRVLNQRQDEFRLMIHAQIDLLNKNKDQTKELKDNLKKSIQRHQQFQMIVQSQNDSIQDLKDQMNKLKLQIKKTTGQVKKINEDSLKSEIMKILNQIIEIKKQTNKSFQIVKSNCEIKINEQQKKIIKNSREIDEVMRKIQKSPSLLEFGGQKKLGLVNKRVQRINQIQKVQSKSEKINKQPQQKSQMIEYKWSQQLKSKAITIKGNIITNQKYTCYNEFCLLNVSFSKTLKSKQSWAIKINKITNLIFLGVCLKSKMLNYNFNSQNIKWSETGHGFYMIGSGGGCYSHSQKKFNNVQKSFKFGVGDVIYFEYDPINKKLRFNKNKVDYFEFSMIEPPQNDAYHPFVALWGQNQSVELINPVQFQKEVNDKRNKGFWSSLWGA